MISYVSEEIAELEAAWARRLEALDASGVDNYAASCDAALLPYLAAAYECDISGLSEEAARRLLADALRRYFAAGTVGAMKRLLRTISEQAVLLQWYEYEAEPHHFKIKLRPGEQGAPSLDAAVLAKYKQLIELTKNAHSVFDGFEGAMSDFAMTLKVCAALVQTRRFERGEICRSKNGAGAVELGGGAMLEINQTNRICKEKKASRTLEVGTGVISLAKFARALELEKSGAGAVELGQAACLYLICDERSKNE